MAKMKILIVDDEKQFADNIADYLNVLGYAAFKSYTGEEAVEILKKEKPDVLISDVKLSGVGAMDGDDVLNSLRSMGLKTIPIMITAYKNEAVKRNLMSKGAVRCIFKPIDLHQLESLLKEIEDEIEK